MSLLRRFHFCFTSTETAETVRDGESRTSTSTSTQLLNSDLLRIREQRYIIVIVKFWGSSRDEIIDKCNSFLFCFVFVFQFVTGLLLKNKQIKNGCMVLDFKAGSLH